MARIQPLCGLLLLVLACAPAAPPAAKPAAAPAPGTPASEASVPARADVVIIGHIPSLGSAPLYVAEARGYFAEQGIEPNWEVFTSGAEILTQTAAGRLNIGTGAAVGSAALNALATGVDVKILTTGHAENRGRPTTALLLRKVDGRVLTVPELRGRKAAINSVGVSTEYTLAEGLRSGGLTLDDIDLVQLPFPDMVPALANGSIDAAVTTEPFGAKAMQLGLAEPVVNVVHEHLQSTVTWINTNFAQQRPDVARRYMIAHLKGLRELQGDALQRDDLVRIVSDHTRLEPEVIKAAAPPYWDPDGRVNVDSIVEQQAFHLTRGSLKYREPLDIRQYVDDAIVPAAVQQLGPYR